MKLELIKRFIEEAEELLAKGDTIQSSEKLYKAVEDGIKLLAKKYNLEEAKIAEQRRRWYTNLLDRAVKALSARVSKDIDEIWNYVYYTLHVNGFHEEKATKDEVEKGLKETKKFLEILEKEISR